MGRNFKFKPILQEKVKEELAINSNNDIHQAIMNVAYNSYNSYLGELNSKLKEENRPQVRWFYSGLCEWTRFQLGDLAEFAVLIGKYNQQVENGGHEQYWFNGYASIDGRYKDLYLHMDLIEYLEVLRGEITFIYPIDELEEINNTINRALNIMRDFPESVEWINKINYAGFNSDGEFEYRDSEDNYNELTDYSKRRLKYLDDDYYMINKKLMDILNLYFNNYLLQ